MKVSKHSHCGGFEKVPEAQRIEIEKALTNCAVQPGLRAASRVRASVLESLVRDGWSNEVAVAVDSEISITSVKRNVGLCLQTGNMSRMYADLIKLQKMFLDGGVKAGAMILPSASAARALGSNIANADRLLKELEIFRKVIHMPIILFSFE